MTRSGEGEQVSYVTQSDEGEQVTQVTYSDAERTGHAEGRTGHLEGRTGHAEGRTGHPGDPLNGSTNGTTNGSNNGPRTHAYAREADDGMIDAEVVPVADSRTITQLLEPFTFGEQRFGGSTPVSAPRVAPAKPTEPPWWHKYRTQVVRAFIERARPDPEADVYQADLASEPGLDEQRVRLVMEDLVEEGQVIATGDRRVLAWRLSQS